MSLKVVYFYRTSFTSCRKFQRHICFSLFVQSVSAIPPRDLFIIAESTFSRKQHFYRFLPPAKEVAGRQCFQACLSVSNSVHMVGEGGRGVFPCGHHPRCIAPHHTALEYGTPPPPANGQGPLSLHMGPHSAGKSWIRPCICLTVVHTEWRRLLCLMFSSLCASGSINYNTTFQSVRAKSH